jgi:hypothetical protein
VLLKIACGIRLHVGVGGVAVVVALAQVPSLYWQGGASIHSLK